MFNGSDCIKFFAGRAHGVASDQSAIDGLAETSARHRRPTPGGSVKVLALRKNNSF